MARKYSVTRYTYFLLILAFWATCKIGQPIQAIRNQVFALWWSALEKPVWELNCLHIFEILSSNRNKKRWRMLEGLFMVFYHSRNIHDTNSMLGFCLKIEMLLLGLDWLRTFWAWKVSASTPQSCPEYPRDKPFLLTMVSN